MFQSFNGLIAASVLFATALGGFASPTPRQTSSTTLHPDASSAKCVDVRGAKLANNTAVQIYDCNGSGAQEWQLQRGSNGHIQLAGSSFCLDAGTNPHNGVLMKIYQCFDNLPAQEWIYGSDNTVKLANADFCLDLTDGNLANSNQLQIWQCTGGKNQVWLEDGSSTPPPPPPTKGRPLHPNGNPNKCIDVQGAKFENNTPVQIYDCNGSDAQQWIVSDGNTKVQVAGKNFCLDATTANPANGVGMKIYECFDNLPAQSWSYTSSHNIKLQAANSCVDLTNGDLTNGNNLQVYECFQGNTNQIWN